MNPLPGVRIAVASSGVQHIARGIETWAVDITRALQNRGVDACLLKGSGAPTASHLTLKCLHRGGRINNWLSRVAPSFFWRFGLKSPYEIEQTTFALRILLSPRGRAFDILHTQDPQLARILEFFSRRGLFSPRVLLAHGTEETLAYLSYFSYLQHLAPQHEEETRESKPNRAQWFVCPNFVDTRRFRPGSNEELRDRLGISHDAFVVITVAAVKRHHKRVDYLINEFKNFRNVFSTETHLIIAGATTGDTPQLIEQAGAAEASNIHFLTDRPHEEMPDILRCGNLFVLCSLKEMMPIALLEAISTGLPALVSEHAVVSWMKGDAGASISMHETGALQQALGEWSVKSRLEQAGGIARQRAVTCFSDSAVVESLVEIYGEISGCPNPS